MEITTTESELHVKAMLFAGGVALAYLKDYKKEITIEDLDHAIRHQLENLGHNENDAGAWSQVYVEYLSHLITSERHGDDYPFEEYTKMCSSLMSIGYAHILNVCDTPDVAIVPPMPADFGVPLDWLEDTATDTDDAIWKADD